MTRSNLIRLIVFIIAISAYIFTVQKCCVSMTDEPDSKLYYEVVTKTTFCKEISKNGVILTVIKTDTLQIDAISEIKMLK